MLINYCMQCGKALVNKPVGDEGEQKYCPECEKFYFDNPACCVLAAIINERGEVLLLKQNYISEKYVLCSGYMKKGDTPESAVCREVFEETGQRVLSCEYIGGYYFEPKNLFMLGFAAYVNAESFGSSKEVDGLTWTDLESAAGMVERENNLSGIHLDNCITYMKKQKSEQWRG